MYYFELIKRYILGKKIKYEKLNLSQSYVYVFNNNN